MVNIHLIGGEKGGVGKSVVARLLAQYMKYLLSVLIPIDPMVRCCAFTATMPHLQLSIITKAWIPL